MDNFPKTDLNRVRRIPKRGHYDKATIYEILDESFICHVGFVVDQHPFVIPTAYGRKDDTLYIHGATTSRMLQQAQQGIPVTVTVTHLDGIVLARSAFHHSMNYRSAVIFGTAKIVEGAEKEEALYIISEQILKGRWDEARQPNAKELKATTVLAIEIEQASAKIRTGPPGDDAEDYELPIWAGVLPITQNYGTPITDPLLKKDIPLAKSVQALSIQRSNSISGRPTASESATFYQRYINRVDGEDIITALQKQHFQTLEFLHQTPTEKWNFRYAPDKWTVKEAWVHVLDTERIMAYRALRIARNDQTPIPGFEQDDYVPASGATNRTPESILAEYEAVRTNTIQLLQNLPPDTWTNTGTASGNPFSVRALAYIIAGHELHHWTIFRERYGI